MTQALISLQGVSKHYPVSGRRGGALSTLYNLLRNRPLPLAFEALSDVSLEVRQGESLGLVGVNGAGKSTLLKIIAGVVKPSAGEVSIHGRVSALLELGAGFHPEYTGRQNVFLAAALIGLTERETRERLDDILAFADIGEHIDQPIKQYSSGMVVRLGFAVATAVQPDVLITDEVLAVGDESFQRKCTRWMEGYLSQGGTLLLCSHSMYQIEKLCARAAWLEGGRIRSMGVAQDVTRDYLAWHDERSRAARRTPGEAVLAGQYAVTALSLNGVTDELEDAVIDTGGALRLEGRVHSPDDRPPALMLGIAKSDGTTVYAVSSDMDGHVLERCADGDYAFAVSFPALPLLPGRYELRVHAMDPEGYRLFDEYARGLVVKGRSRELGVCHIPHRWE